MNRLSERAINAPVVLAATLAVLAGCAKTVHEVSPPVPHPAATEIEASLYLVGDAGAPAAGGDPVLQALTADLRSRTSESLVVFLGDNIYPKGMPPEDDPDRSEAERRLDAQTQAALEGSARTIFIPGNHDWEQGGDDGWWRIYRQGVYLDSVSSDVELLPRHGCPGPVERDFGDRLRLIIIDTQWYLHGGPKPTTWSSCRVRRPEELGDSVAAALARAGNREVVVLAHHPMQSDGPHGGHFTAKQHIFPVTEAAGWAWIPLPIIGSLYPLSRQSGISSQDQSGSRNEAMRATLDSAFRTRPPLVYASGHEHNLEVLESQSVEFLLVSGAGYYGHTSATGWSDNTRFAASESGYMRIDVLRGAGLRLSVLIVDEVGDVTEMFSMYLRDPGARDAD